MSSTGRTYAQVKGLKWAADYLYAQGYTATRVSNLSQLTVKQIAIIVRELAACKKRLEV